MTFRTYDHERDVDAARRIWREVGWLTSDDTSQIDAFLTSSRGHVAELGGAPECLVLTQPGTVRYLDRDLPLGIVAAVTTSLIARKQRLGGRLTARAIAHDVEKGAAVSALGMFEQGYYDKLGFGSGAYSHRVALQTSGLRVPRAGRPPRRLSADDYEAMHASRLARRRGHGACTIDTPLATRSDVHEDGPGGFGLGFFDGPGGELSHHMWIHPRGNVENGPYYVYWTAWQTPEQFLELMGVLRNLDDQIPLMYVWESNGIQLQDLGSHPVRDRVVSTGSKYDARMTAFAWWQMRINDVPACVAATTLPVADAVRFNLRLTDPIESSIDEGAPWRGVAGDYVVTFGSESAATPGSDAALPTLEASVNAFTRLWLGVRPASALAMTSELTAPSELLSALDRTLRLPSPNPDWMF